MVSELMHLEKPIEIVFSGKVFRYNGAGNWETKGLMDMEFTIFTGYVPGEVFFAVSRELSELKKAKT